MVPKSLQKTGGSPSQFPKILVGNIGRSMNKKRSVRQDLGHTEEDGFNKETINRPYRCNGVTHLL